MRVLLVTGVVGGGVGRHVRELAHDLVAAGHDVVLACPRAVVEQFDLPATGATVRETEIGVARSATLARAQARLRALTRGADVVHAHGMRAGAAAALAVGRTHRRVGVASRHRRRTPLVVSSHNGPPEGRAAAWTYAALEVVVCRRADLVLGVSADLVQRARERGARAADLAVVPSGAAARASDAERQRAREDLRVELGVSPSAGVILTAGRLASQKRVDRVIQAHRTLVDDRRLAQPPVLVVVGDGPLDGPLQEQARRGGAEVHFLGRRADVPRLLSGADVVVSCADWEGQPLVLQEALAAGAPIVATDVGGTAALLDGAGVLVPAGAGAGRTTQPDPVVALLAAEVGALLADPRTRAELSGRARARAARLPTGRDALEAALTAYRSVLGRSATP